MIAGILVDNSTTGLLDNRNSDGSNIFIFFNWLLGFNNRSPRPPSSWSCFIVTDKILDISNLIVTIVCILGFLNLFNLFHFFLRCWIFLLFFYRWSVRKIIAVFTEIIRTFRSSVIIIFSVSVGDPSLGPHHNEDLNVAVKLEN